MNSSSSGTQFAFGRCVSGCISPLSGTLHYYHGSPDSRCVMEALQTYRNVSLLSLLLYCMNSEKWRAKKKMGTVCLAASSKIRQAGLKSISTF